MLRGQFQPIALAKHFRVLPRACPRLQFAVATEVQDDRLVVRLQNDGSLVLLFQRENLVGSLGSAQYEKTPAQVDKIEGYLNAAVRAAVARLRGEAEADNTIEI